MAVLSHILFYGLLGWCVEILFTGLYAVLVKKEWAASGQTYLWMLPIYGLGGYGFEGLTFLLKITVIPVRIFVYLLVIYLVEYVSGYTLKKVIGICPWDYGSHKWSINGLVRLDYAPFWLGLCFLIEPSQQWINKMICE